MRRMALLVFVIDLLTLLTQYLFPVIMESDPLFAILVAALLITGVVLAIRAHRRVTVVGGP